MPAASGFDRRGKASWPMRLVIALLFFTIFASRCFAFGAYAVGYDAKRKQFESFLILNRSTAQEAEDIALRACQNKSFTDCAIKYTFSNTCIAIAFTRNRLIRFIDTDPSLEYARTKVMTACESSPGIKCFIGEAGCDRAKAFAPIRPPGSRAVTAIGTQPSSWIGYCHGLRTCELCDLQSVS